MKTTLALGLAAVLAACAGSPESAPPPAPAASHGDVREGGEAAGIHNMAEVVPGVFRGAQPEGEKSFAYLASLGVKVALSVDGARPDVETAAKHGIRYVHVPMEYSGVTREEQVRMAKAAVEIEGPIFVHCHHGKHRGPAASSFVAMARTSMTPAECIADMRKAGTDPKYSGLYGDVGAFRPVTAAERASLTDADIGPVAKTSDLVESMVKVDAGFDRMKAVKKAMWKSPADMPDVKPSHEARILAERFRELARLNDSRLEAADFKGWVTESENASWDLEKAIEAGDGAAAAKALDRVNTTCNACHEVYRNHRKP
jgi:hypothetical protein